MRRSTVQHLLVALACVLALVVVQAAGSYEELDSKLQAEDTQWATIVGDLDMAMVHEYASMMEVESQTSDVMEATPKKPVAAKKPATKKGPAAAKKPTTAAPKKKGPIKKVTDIPAAQFRAAFLKTRRPGSNAASAPVLPSSEAKAAVKRFGKITPNSPNKNRRTIANATKKVAAAVKALTSKKPAAAVGKRAGAAEPKVAKKPAVKKATAKKATAKKGRFAQVAQLMELDAEAELDMEAESESEVEAEVDAESESEMDADAEVESDAAAEFDAKMAAFALGPTGRTVGASGSKAGASGSKAGASGSKAGASGSKAGASGSKAGASGSKAGASGSKAGASGSKAGASGSKAGIKAAVVVAPASTADVEKFEPFTGPVFNNPKDKTNEQRICRTVASIWFRRYAHSTAQKLWQFGLSLFGGGAKQFLDDPLKFCREDWIKWVEKLHPEQVYLRQAFDELSQHPSNTPFINQIIAKADDTPRDQEQCGSCWAQSAVGSYEAALKKAGKLTATQELSIQQILDCVKTKNSDGCSGGTPQDALDWLKKNSPALESEYPYTGKKGTCRAVPTSAVAKVPKSKGWAFACKSCMKGPCTDQYQYETELLFAVKSDGPFIAYVDASNWQSYNGGIYPHAKCSSASEAGNHVVQLMGFGQDKGVPYWIIKNSWGTSWGEKGMIRLAMGVNACGIANFVGRATIY